MAICKQGNIWSWKSSRIKKASEGWNFDLRKSPLSEANEHVIKAKEYLL